MDSGEKLLNSNDQPSDLNLQFSFQCTMIPVIDFENEKFSSAERHVFKDALIDPEAPDNVDEVFASGVFPAFHITVGKLYGVVTVVS